MNTKAFIAHTLGLVLLLGIAAGQAKGLAPEAPSPVLSTDTDLGHGYVRRDGAIHFIARGITGTGANATRIDMPSPELLKKVVDSQFGPFKTAEGLDVATFEALSEDYTRDKNRVYYKVVSNGDFIVILLPEAHPASFEALTFNLARDRNHVWYRDRIQKGADPATFKLINKSFAVFLDKDSVHYQNEIIAGADPASFKHLASGYYADRNRIYWGSTPIPDADRATFQVLGDSFVAKDQLRAYRSGEPLDGFDADSLELILHNDAGFQIFSDKNGIHLNKMTFPRSKPGKVAIIDNKTVQAGDLIHLVNTYQDTPVTLFKVNGKLMAETPSYEPTSRKVDGIISAEVTPGGLRNIQVSALPGSNRVPEVPDWQMEVFTHVRNAGQMIELGKRIK